MAIVEQKKSGVTRVEMLDGKKPASIQIKGKDVKPLSADVGQELVISGADSEEEELISVDGVERVPIEANLTVADVKATKNRINPDEVAEKDRLLKCLVGCLPQDVAARFDKMRERAVMQGLHAPAPGQNVAPIIANGPAAVNHALESKVVPGGQVRYIKPALFTVSDAGDVNLTNGQLVLAASRPTNVKTSQAMVSAKAGSIISVSGDSHTTRIMAIWQPGSGSTNIVVGNQSFTLRDGMEIDICDGDPAVDQLHKTDTVARRREMIQTVANGAKVLISEVSFLSFITNSPVLMSLVQSKSADDQALSKKLMKMATVLSIVTSSHGNYAPAPVTEK